MKNMQRQGGFSLVELMVSIVIGLLAVIFATRLMTDGEKTKDAALGGSDSMQNGMLAMFQISGDAEYAGFGLNEPLIVGCDTYMEDSEDYQLAPAQRGGVAIRPLAAAVIENGGAGPDRLSLYAGTSPTGTGIVRLQQDYIGGTQLTIDRRPYGFARGDAILVAPEKKGGRCSLAQVSNDLDALAPPPSSQYLMIGGAGNRFNSGALAGAYKGEATRIFNLGPAASLALRTWSIERGYLRLRATDLAGASEASQPVADNIVSLKAQYGLDTRAGAAFTPEQGLRVSAWSSTMLDADNNGTAGSAGDYQRIAALRIAVVARARNPERPNPATGQCTATTVRPTVFATLGADNGNTAPVQVDVAVTGDAVDWRCYRYRVFETIVPLRNAGWRPTSS
ncbi:PilW family protein [Massilia sp. G4R7]|uniref:PilW family protein n=1 Tax=Massilia phyllostachyos TaxID=2898585 RepID=A0ABS8QD74_9BURK|nr:PilW family protein [Massilia phyllostachyos]MCD2519483.1 PilW family protein [Massilia phyllostachyos]